MLATTAANATDWNKQALDAVALMGVYKTWCKGSSNYTSVSEKLEIIARGLIKIAGSGPTNEQAVARVTEMSRVIVANGEGKACAGIDEMTNNGK